MRDYITDEHRAIISAATGQPCTDALVERFLARIPEHIARREAKRKAIHEAALADYPRKVRKWTANRKAWFERFTEIADWEERKQNLDAMQATLPKLPDKAATKAMHMRLKQLGDRPAEIESEPQPPKTPEPLRTETEEEAWLHLMADMAATAQATPAPTKEPVPVGNTLPEMEAEVEVEVEVETALPPRDVIPEVLAPFARDDEDAAEFRERIKTLWQRFGIKDGHHTADMPPLSSAEKIEMREIDIANERSGNWVGR